jgi:hypothetical protein
MNIIQEKALKIAMPVLKDMLNNNIVEVENFLTQKLQKIDNRRCNYMLFETHGKIYIAIALVDSNDKLCELREVMTLQQFLNVLLKNFS